MDEQKNICIVDDDQVSLYVMKKLLEKEGYNVFIASDYKQAIMIIDNKKLDLLLLDIMMPEVDGTAILHITKNTAKLEQPFPILYVSVLNPKDVDTSSADGFIQKPFKHKKFVTTVKKFLNE